jgi:recombination DNA repair RAD52 pathway protein
MTTETQEEVQVEPQPVLPVGTPITELQQKVLMAGLNPDRVANRQQGRQQLSYLEAWDVKATLIRVFGFGGFSAECLEAKIVDMREVPQSQGQGKNWKVTAQASVRLTIHQTGAIYTESAIAGSAQPDITESMDMALKSAESDALKRAAIYLGTQFGLSLYDNGRTQDIVKKVFSPDQLWPKPPKENQQQQQQPQQGPRVLPAGNGMTDEQRQANEALLQRSMNMNAERDRERQAEYERQQAEIDSTTPNQ